MDLKNDWRRCVWGCDGRRKWTIREPTRTSGGVDSVGWRLCTFPATAVGVPAEATRSTANPLGPFENNNSRRACRCRHDFADDVQISLPIILNREREEKIKTFSSFFVLFYRFSMEKAFEGCAHWRHWPRYIYFDMYERWHSRWRWRAATKWLGMAPERCSDPVTG